MYAAYAAGCEYVDADFCCNIGCGADSGCAVRPGCQCGRKVAGSNLLDVFPGCEVLDLLSGEPNMHLASDDRDGCGSCAGCPHCVFQCDGGFQIRGVWEAVSNYGGF